MVKRVGGDQGSRNVKNINQSSEKKQISPSQGDGAVGVDRALFTETVVSRGSPGTIWSTRAPKRVEWRRVRCGRRVGRVFLVGLAA